ncbi:DUF2637 domain-containing protein [Streptomyces sp. NPDC048623]|uniref:DUF2637 domain-containing protein n=1 Tax=Streptomyces sp. NPDC048623 TaxID=3155761 RepID=UPI0034271FEA
MTTLPAARAGEPDALDPDEWTDDPATEEDDDQSTPPTEETTGAGHRGLMIPIAIVAVLAGLAAAATGFALSYGALRAAAESWGFGSGWQSHVFPVGVDGLIIALYSADLVLAWLRMARPWVRMTAHALTGVTIVLNAAAAAGSAPGSPGLWDAIHEHPGRLLGHAMMPIAYLILTEVARWAIVRTARLEAGFVDDERLTLAEWLLKFPTTWAIFRHAKTWPATYAESRTHVRELAIYRVWLKHRAEIERGLDEGRVGVLDRMPALLERFGVSVQEARAIPDQMLKRERTQKENREREDRDRKRREDEAERRERIERERQKREDEHRTRMEGLAMQAAETKQSGELAALQAKVDGETRAAAHRAEAAATTAGIEAAAATEAAQRTAAEDARRAAAEKEAEEDATTAALRRQAAEDAAATAHAAAATAKHEQTIAEADAKRAEARRDEKRAEADARVADAKRAEADAREAAALAALRATELRAVALEDALMLSDRDRRVRRVAWMIGTRAGGDPLRLPLADVERELGVQNGAASTYRKDAGELIATGYDHNLDPLHEIYQQIYQQS